MRKTLVIILVLKMFSYKNVGSARRLNIAANTVRPNIGKLDTKMNIRIFIMTVHLAGVIGKVVPISVTGKG